MTAAKNILRCSSTTTSTVLSAEEPKLYPHKRARDVRLSKWKFQTRNMPKTRLPAMVDRAAWKEVTNKRAVRRWDRVFGKVWKEIGGTQEEFMPAGEIGQESKEGQKLEESF